jgi:hypothetical protein
MSNGLIVEKKNTYALFDALKVDIMNKEYVTVGFLLAQR